MYYTSSGSGNSQSSGYSGQGGNQQYYGSGTGFPQTSDPSSRLMSGTGMPYTADMEHGNVPQSAYAGSASWVDSSLASAQRSLQSWKSVGLTGASLGMERPPGMDPAANRMPGRFPAPGPPGPPPTGPSGRGVTQTRPRLATGVQTFQPKGGANLRGNGAAPPVRAGPPGPPTLSPSTFTAGYRNTAPVGGSAYSEGQNQAAPRAPSPAQQPGFGRGTAAPVRNAAPVGGGAYSEGQNQAAPRAASSAQQPRFGRETSAPSARAHAPRPANAIQPPPWLNPPARPNAGPRMTTAPRAPSGPVPLMDITPFQARLQDFSTKTCSDLGISVQSQPGTKKHCSLEGFSTKPADSDSSQKEVEGDKDNDDDAEDDDDDSDDEDVDMSQCKLCNIKFEKEQVYIFFFMVFLYL